MRDVLIRHNQQYIYMMTYIQNRVGILRLEERPRQSKRKDCLDPRAKADGEANGSPQGLLYSQHYNKERAGGEKK